METTKVSPATETVAPIQKHKVNLGSFGNGRYSQAMSELFKDCQRLFEFTPQQAHVTAERLGVDAGQLLAASAKLKYGSLSKDGMRSLKEVTKAVKVKESWAMTVGYLCAEIDDLRKQGLIVKDIEIDPLIMESVDIAASRVE